MPKQLPFQLDDPSLLHESALLNGDWVQSLSRETFDIEDPGTGKVFAKCPVNKVPDVDTFVKTSNDAFLEYRHLNPRQRAKMLLKWYDLITNAREDIAKLVVYETGKPLVEARGEVDYALGFAWWFAGEAERIRGSIATPAVSGRRTFVIKQPIGVSVALVPWNFPVAMIIRKVAAALAAGCSMIVKPSPETPLSVLALADLALRAGFPRGVFNVITTDNANTPSVSESLCKHLLVRKVTFTGSTAVGKLIAKHCSEGLKKVTLELGGNCPFIVFNDANLEQAVAALMILKWRTAGQACTHANRVYVQNGVYDKFTQLILEATRKLRVGHGADPSSTMGALTTPRGIEKLERHISDAVLKGGKILCGSRRPKAPGGYFFEPTIISDMTASMLTTQEEIFGPLLGLYRFESEEEVVKMANDTSMGLASYFFTNDVDRTYRLLESLEAGMIGMNTGNASGAESPFGGIKESGYGKEAGKEVAIEEYLIAKTGTLTIEPLSKLLFALNNSVSIKTPRVNITMLSNPGKGGVSSVEYSEVGFFRLTLHKLRGDASSLYKPELRCPASQGELRRTSIDMTVHRRPVFFNRAARSWSAEPFSLADLIENFHQQLKDYQKSPLVSLDDVAKDIGVGSVNVKVEASRLGLPAIEILGASWAVFRAVTETLCLPLESGIEEVKTRLSEQPVTLFTATQGSHGRAVARMGTILAVPVEIYVPVDLSAEAIAIIKSEGATVIEAKGDYATAIVEAQAASQLNKGIMVQDNASDGNGDVSQWIVEGYSTIMREIDDQLDRQQIDLVVSPVGGGSLAYAAITHCKAAGRSTAFMTVEPDTAGCLWKGLTRGELAVETTSATIMAGLQCGTLSKAAWEPLKGGTDASVTISDYEAHLATLDLQRFGITTGPSGASTLAALRRLDESEKARLGLDENSVIVLLCTKSTIDYTIPKDVATDDVVSLTQTLVRIDSSNPDLGSTGGPGETAIAQYITAWLQHRDIESHWIEPTPTRPSVVGIVRGSGGGKSLMFNGHTDTVTLLGYDGDPLDPKIANGNIYGRGSADMKSGLAAAMIALASAKGLKLKGDVILAAVADEEAESIGTDHVLQAGWRADAAIVAEPTEMAIINTHKGLALFEVDIHGLAAHGSRPDLGIDAICKAGYFLVELDRHAQELSYGQGGGKPDVSAPNIHASIIKGGEEVSSYPAYCTISIERRTVAGETPITVKAELMKILDRLSVTVPDFKFELRSIFAQSPYFIARDHDFVNLVVKEATKSTGTAPPVRGETYWTDMALLSDVGIPGVIWGPKGYGLHSKTEWVEIESVRQLTEAFVAIEADFCK
ncbi:hypothetical protein V492_02456 [Pseudogymnoascus sp. VKM F-4246]|nr:hypothetical protein V492_02456 [Pseudogymnoascus sp. VKM F-4246]